jgi:hypothetical protein
VDFEVNNENFPDIVQMVDNERYTICAEAKVLTENTTLWFLAPQVSDITYASALEPSSEFRRYCRSFTYDADNLNGYTGRDQVIRIDIGASSSDESASYIVDLKKVELWLGGK